MSPSWVLRRFSGLESLRIIDCHGLVFFLLDSCQLAPLIHHLHQTLPSLSCRLVGSLPLLYCSHPAFWVFLSCPAPSGIGGNSASSAASTHSVQSPGPSWPLLHSLGPFSSPLLPALTDLGLPGLSSNCSCVLPPLLWEILAFLGRKVELEAFWRRFQPVETFWTFFGPFGAAPIARCPIPCAHRFV